MTKKAATEQVGLLHQTISVTLEGLSDLGFDRFIDHSGEKRPPEQKLYFGEGNAVVIPGTNIDSFLFRQMPPMGCALSFEAQGGKKYRAVGAANVVINDMLIPLMHGDKPAVFNGFDKDGWYIMNGAPITKSGASVIKQVNNPRPCLHLPWSISFTMTLFKNSLIDENKLHNWFDMGGIQIALGNWRPQHGRFLVTKWEVK